MIPDEHSVARTPENAELDEVENGKEMLVLTLGANSVDNSM